MPEITEDKTQKLHKYLYDKGLYSRDYNEFQTQFSTPDKISSLYAKLVEKQLYSKSAEEFNEQFFTVKKKKFTTGTCRRWQDGFISGVRRAYQAVRDFLNRPITIKY